MVPKCTYLIMNDECLLKKRKGREVERKAGKEGGRERGMEEEREKGREGKSSLE